MDVGVADQLVALTAILIKVVIVWFAGGLSCSCLNGGRLHLKHAYTFDPMKQEWADYAAVQA